MSDLISRRFLLNYLKDWQKEVSGIGYEREYNLLEQIIKGVENEPTAYDADKVVEQMKDHALEFEAFGQCSDYVELTHAIEIVRVGGVNE